MAQDIFHQETYQKITVERGLTNFKSYAIMHFHPRYFFLDSIGLIWSIYFLWEHNWASALGALLFGRLMGLISVMNLDVEAFAQTTWGKLGLLHLHPMNMIIQILGIFVFAYGIWEHETLIILGGISFVLLGHLAGWNKVNSSF
jgi:hypothetical protein